MKCEKSCGCVVVNNGKILVINQKSGFYGFPKGHIENNETEIETAIREVKEETNVNVIPDINKKYIIEYEMIKQDEKIIKRVIYFLAKTENIELKPQKSEINKVLWVDIDKVEDILTFENMKNLWKKFYLILKIYKLFLY